MPSSGDAHIDFTEEVTPDKGSLNKLAKTFIPFILLFLTKAGYQFTLVISLRVVQTQAILFLKSMSERVGSDLERLLNWIMNF